MKYLKQARNRVDNHPSSAGLTDKINYETHQILYGMKRYPEVLPYAEQSYQYALQNFGQKNVWTGLRLANLSYLYLELDQGAKALKGYLAAKEIMLNFSDENSVAIQHLNRFIALSYSANFQYDKAKLMLLEVLKYHQKAYGDNSLEVAETYNEIGYVLSLKGEYLDALNWTGKALAVEFEMTDRGIARKAFFKRNLAEIQTLIKQNGQRKTQVY